MRERLKKKGMPTLLIDMFVEMGSSAHSGALDPLPVREEIPKIKKANPTPTGLGFAF